MELVLGQAAELRPGPYIDCPEEGCVYILEDGALTRLDRGSDQVIGIEVVVVDSADVPPHERPRLHRIARMLVESQATSRLASPYVVFVPREEAGLAIRAGSGIVGAPSPGADLILVYYEGALYGQTDMARLADRVFYAHGRLVERYPTVARMTLPSNLLSEVGTFDPDSGTIAPVDAHAESALASWLGTEDLDQSELCRSSRAR